MKKENISYNIGLDIGTGSVGYCVTDNNGNIVKIKDKKNMWGVNLFEGAQTAAETRSYRGMRRRYDRRRQRIELLREFFINDGAIDPNFFNNLDASFLNEDHNLYNLFIDENYNDRTYYQQFKTIYHLRKYLQECEEKADIRLVYLALHHIVKYRGNFLYEDSNISASNADISTKVVNLFNEMHNYYDFSFDDNLIKDVLLILNDNNLSRKDKEKAVLNRFTMQTEISCPYKNIVNAFLGEKSNFSDIFNITDKLYEFKLSDDNKVDDLIASLGENENNLFSALVELNSAMILKDILQFDPLDHSRRTLSSAMIYKYNQYKEDLSNLKVLYKKYLGHSEYKTMFGKSSDEKNSKTYTIYNNNPQKCTREELYSSINNKFNTKDKDKDDDKDNDVSAPFKSDPLYIRMMQRIKERSFLNKVNSTDRGAIPYQLNLEEMKQIIKNQGQYYPFLLENEEKITAIVSFRIPYWCGPLNSKINPTGSRQFGWAVRKDSTSKIYPWNFNDVVDIDNTAERFITTLTNYCTYLPTEKVLPKNSLLYSEYMLRNEIYSININGKFLDAKVRNNLFNAFCQGINSMTSKGLSDWLFKNEKINAAVEDIKGFQSDGKFANNMKSYNDFKAILGVINSQNYNDIERMIYYLTVYNDKKIIERRISQDFPTLSKEQICNIVDLKYSGWGALSEKLLNGISVIENDVAITVIGKMRMCKYNFAHIINQKDFREAIELEMLSKCDEEKDIDDIITNLQGSPSIKKGIRQSIRVVDELVSIMGSAPNNIFIEFAREDQDSVRTSTRKKTLLKQYEKLKENPDFIEIYKFIMELDEKKLDDKMLYLYCLQNGKCLYSGKRLDPDRLSQTCQIDHILPRCYIKDDSFDNRALVLSNENQRKKDSLLLEDRIIDSQYNYWKILNRNKLISDAKFRNLTRRDISPSDAKGFINRQLVETRQITKHVANLLKEKYSSSGTQIVQIKAGLISDLRDKYEIKKDRDVNDYHHAHDAYMACIIGEYIRTCFPKVYSDFDFLTAKQYFAIRGNKQAIENKYGFVINQIGNVFSNDLGEILWNGPEVINNIIKAVDYKDCFISKKVEKQSGKFYKDTIYPAGSKEAAIPIKCSKNCNKSVELYGGYTGSQEAYSIIIEYDKNGRKTKKLVGIPIQIDTMSKSDPNAINSYLCSNGYSNYSIIKTNICKYQRIILNNAEYYISSSTEIHNATQLVLPLWAIRAINSKDDKNDDILIQIFSILTKKIEQHYCGYSNIIQKLNENNAKVLFMSLDNKEKKDTIKQMLIMLHANATNANLKSIGLSAREGRKSRVTINVDDVVFVNTSVTGIFENKVFGKNL